MFAVFVAEVAVSGFAGRESLFAAAHSVAASPPAVAAKARRGILKSSGEWAVGVSGREVAKRAGDVGLCISDFLFASFLEVGR